jgi:hypothetical protein
MLRLGGSCSIGVPHTEGKRESKKMLLWNAVIDQSINDLRSCDY